MSWRGRFGLAVRGEPITLGPETHPRTPPRWLRSLTGAAELVAPLIGRQAPDMHQAARDRRSQVAAILGIVGIALAAFQFLAGALDLVNLLFGQGMARIVGLSALRDRGDAGWRRRVAIVSGAIRPDDHAAPAGGWPLCRDAGGRAGLGWVDGL